MVGREKTECRCTHLGENIFNYKIISIVLLAEFSNRCSSCCIAVRIIDNIDEIDSLFFFFFFFEWLLSLKKSKQYKR